MSTERGPGSDGNSWLSGCEKESADGTRSDASSEVASGLVQCFLTVTDTGGSPAAAASDTGDAGTAAAAAAVAGDPVY